MTEIDTEDPELTEFFKQLQTDGVMSAEALGEISSEIAAARKGGGTLQRADVSKPAPIRTVQQEEEEQKDLRAAISEMALPDKIKLAMLGDGTARMLLIADTNRLVQQAVLNNPRMQDGEVEVIARNPNVADFVLRFVSNNRTWMKQYAVKYALVTNPKAPADISVKWLRFLNKNDLRKIARSKNVPQLVSVTARKRLVEMEKR